jgi:molybdenum cofactor guanylyltransferase
MAKRGHSRRYHHPMSTTTAFILAGGRSSRMGSDKALLRVGEQSLLQRALLTASQAADTVRIVGPGERYAAFGEMVEDIFRDCGPLGGIHAALRSTSTASNLMLSVDLPMMSSTFLRWLLQQAEMSSALIVVPDAAGGPQPLCAIYRRDALDAMEDALKRGEYKIGGLFSQLPTRMIAEQEIVANGFSTAIFQNINTPEEYDSLLRSATIARSKQQTKAES